MSLLSLNDRRTTRRGHLIEPFHRPEEDSWIQRYEDIDGTEVLVRFPDALSQDLPLTLAHPAALTLISSLLAQRTSCLLYFWAVPE